MSLGIKSSAFLRVAHPLCQQFEVQNLSWIYCESIVNLSWIYREPNYRASIVSLSRIYPEPIVNLSCTYPRCQPFEVNYICENHGNWSEIGPYGSIWAHIKTGRSPMAHDHFQNPPDPKEGHKNRTFFLSPGGRWKTWCQETLGHLSQGTGWYLASWSCLCSAVLGHPPPAAVPQHSTAQEWPTGQIPSSALAKMT